MTSSKDIARFRANWQKEIDGAALYSALADVEEKDELANVYRNLAASERKHAAVWEKRLAEAGVKLGQAKPSWRAHTMGSLAKRFGAGFVLPTIVGNEQADSRAYDNQPEARTETGRMSADEKSHARLVAAASGRLSGLMGSEVAQLEGRHRAGGGNALRAAVLGANDGLVSVLSLTMGAAGANLPGHGVLITGIAGLLAGASSMALGEWLSVQSSRELYQNQMKIEAEEIEHAPQEEQEELALIYQSKGLPKERARELAAAQMAADKNTILDTLAREELGIDPNELGGSPWVAAFTSFFLFSAGAIVPLFPYLFLNGLTAAIVSLALGALALFLTGAAITLMTGRSVWVSGFRQVLIGVAAALLVFGVGRLIGVSVGG
ncbi:MAG TPA: VIT1/CCC1 transporter family protein [Anaerolineales bacterium]|nr:VIT1/CCC1 transporter family protein [Anaerolineales bacterium]